MRAPPRLALPITMLCLAFLAPPAQGQEEWQGPQNPCRVRSGHFLVTGATNHLRIAVETDDPGRRESRLDEAHRVLTEAILEKNQGDNPGAWYYLGRYYVYRGDAWGADSAFRKVLEALPDCAEDVGMYIGRLTPEIRAAAVEAWQGEQLDSAAALFQLARTLAPEDAEIPLFLSMMYANAGELDSAAKYVTLGVEIAGDDTTHERRVQQAMLDVARGYETLAFESPAVSRITESRMHRDTLLRAVHKDSILLAQLIAEWAGRTLRPDVQQAVARDSARIADRLAAARVELPEAIEMMAQDSAEADGLMSPALDAYARYLEVFPDDGQTAIRLLRRYSLVGYTAEMERLIEDLGQRDIDVVELATTGRALYNDGHPAHAALLLETVLARNGYIRDALYTLCRAYYTLQDAEHLKPVARQLLEVDPLNAQNLRMVAAAWDLEGNMDSTIKYVAQADTGIGWYVRVTQMVTMGPRTVINGTVQNIAPRDLEPITLEFDFLNAAGEVVATGRAEIPALARMRRQAIEVETDQPGAIAWRYRRTQ
jgi:tetratricopeptide (TPR) repeat protein